MRVLVTGGLGFIGRKLCSSLVGLGHEVKAIDSVTPQVHGHAPCVDLHEGVELLRCDIRELHHQPETIDHFDAVYHLAAETGTAQSMYRIGHYVDVNERGTASLLEALGRCSSQPRKVILASSRSVYGEGAYTTLSGEIVQPAPRTREQLDAGQWELRGTDGGELTAIATPETLGFAPGSVYAATKASQELLLTAASQALGFDAVILRLQNVYGEGQSLQNPYTGIISIFFNRARQGLTLPIYEDGRESRDFVHIDDVVAAFVSALERDVPSGTVCNIGSGSGTSVEELAAQMLAAGALDVPIKVTGQFRLGDIRHCYADIEKARSLLAFQPRISLGEGLRRFCVWAEGQPVYDDGLDQATAELVAKGLAS